MVLVLGHIRIFSLHTNWSLFLLLSASSDWGALVCVIALLVDLLDVVVWHVLVDAAAAGNHAAMLVLLLVYTR